MLQKAKPKRKRLLDYGKEYADSLVGLISGVLIDTKYSRIGRVLARTIPVLSIFAFLGMNVMLFNITSGDVPAAFAAGSASSGTSASLIIDNGNIVDRISATHGETAYASHVVKVSASNITDYALTITGPTSLTGTSSIGGAGGKTGSALADNTWGYAWGDKSASEASMTYNSFDGSAQTLTGNPAVSNNAVDFERKLTFAAKFGDDAADGHYTASVNLNLVATPYAITVGTWNTNGVTKNSGITYMDQMTETVCSQVATPAVGILPKGVPTMALIDRRDGKTYRIARLTDGKCWMIDNLALDLGQAGIASVAYSDNLSANYPTTALVNRFGAESTNAWENDNTKEEFSKAPAKISTANPGDNNGYQPEYGYYYSWCAATAGTCASVTSKNADTSGSICPKGWRLPSAKSNSYANNDFIGLMKKTSYSGWNGNSLVTETNFPVADFGGKNVAAAQLRTDGIKPATFYLGGADWYRAGFVNSDGLYNSGSEAFYWSRTALSGTAAYYLRLWSDGSLLPAGTFSGYGGNSVRCVAEETKENTYTITFDKNRSEPVRNIPEPITCTSTTESCTTTLPSQMPSMSCSDAGVIAQYAFDGWREKDANGNFTGSTFKPGSTITVSKDTVLYLETSSTIGGVPC